MTIRLTKDLEQFVQDAVRSGLYAREDDVVRDALTRLQKGMVPPKKKAKAAAKGRTAKPKEAVTPEELTRRLIAAGLVTQLPDPSQDIDDDDDPPIVIEGEPLSETIIRERR